MENNGMRTEEEKKEMVEQIAQAATRAIHEETQEEKSAEVEQQQGEKEEATASRFSLTREQIGTMAKNVKEFIVRNSKVIIAGGLIVISASVFTMCNANNKNQAEGNNTPSITDQNNDIDEEKKEIVITPAETTTPVSTTTSEPEEIIVTTPVSTTTSEPEEIIVTKPVSTTTSKPEEIKVEKPVSTTKKVKEEQEPVVIEKPEPIIVSNLEQKEDDLIIALESVGIYANDKVISNTIRVLNSDYIEHDDLKEITEVEYSQVIDLLLNYGSVNNVTFSAGYMGYIPEITEGVYLPTSILPESGKKLQEAFIKVSEEYRLELNKATNKATKIATRINDIGLTAEEDIQIQEEIRKELEKLGISDVNLYDNLANELYNEKEAEICNKKLEQNQIEHDKEVSKAYKNFYKTTIELVNSKEYEKLTPAERLAVFINVSGAMTSGIQEKYMDKYMDKYMNFHNGIVSSVNQTREDLIVANTLNISQQEALDKIVENNKPVVNQERTDLKDLDQLLEELYENKELLIKEN